MSLLALLNRRRLFYGIAILPWRITLAGAADGDPSPTAFRREVLDILHDSFPEKDFTPAVDAEEIVFGDSRIYLGNLRSLVAGMRRDQRRVEIVKWFSSAMASLDEVSPKDWATAQPLLRVKLLTREYVQPLPEMVYFPLVGDFVMALVIDLRRGDEYVTHSNLSDWYVDLTTLRDRGVANLEAMSRNIDLQPSKPPGGRGAFIAVQKGDAYDASRLLLPEFRGRLLDKLGSPAFACAPNRDFLVAWSSDFSAQSEFIAQIKQDAQSQPYSLSAEILRFDHDGLRLASAADLTTRH